uniref:Uncharacterized protein n=1 Tax=Panagrolaimus sp. JU765 TaxID=591449 RepID=A0AC34RF61_9BILA
MKSTIVLILLFGTTCAFKFNPFGIFGHDSSEENNKPHPSGPTGEEFPFPTFLINGNLSADSLNSWFEILRNESASRADVQNAQDIWALQQSSDVQRIFH